MDKHLSNINNLLKRSLIISDLDGTLLNRDEQISDYTVKTVKKLIEKGHVFVIATGRPIRSSIHFYKQLGLDGLIVNLNGSVISNPSDDKFDLINLSFSKEIPQLILKDKQIINAISCMLIENLEGTYFITRKEDTQNLLIDTFMKRFHISKGDENTFIYDFDSFKPVQKDPNSILLYIKDRKKVDEITFRIKGLTNTLLVREWSVNLEEKGTVLEINSIFSNKGTAMKFLSSYYGIPRRRIYAFGDGENDLEMLQKCNGVAMCNGTRTTKLLAWKITKKTNQENGVAYELNKLFKLGC